MLMGLTVPKLLLIFAIGLLVFGPGKLPLVGKSLGKSVREFKSAVTEDGDCCKVNLASVHEHL